MNNNELYHYGRKGMKWGQNVFTKERLEGLRVGKRRYQNEDGSLTARGQLRYERDQRENKGKKKGNKVGQADPNRWVREDLERTKRLTDSSKHLVEDLDRINNKTIKSTPKVKMNLSKMTDKEMRDKINRAYLERQYADMFAPQKVSKGREYAAKVMDVGKDVMAVTSSSLAIALAIKELRG